MLPQVQGVYHCLSVWCWKHQHQRLQVAALVGGAHVCEEFFLTKEIWTSMNSTRPKQGFCNSHWSSHQLPLPWQALSDRFCECGLQKRPLVLFLHSFGFLFTLEISVGLCIHLSGQSDGYAATQGPTFSKPICYLTDCEGGHTGCWLPQGLKSVPPPASLICWRDLKVPFLFL